MNKIQVGDYDELRISADTEGYWQLYSPQGTCMCLDLEVIAQDHDGDNMGGTSQHYD